MAPPPSLPQKRDAPSTSTSPVASRPITPFVHSVGGPSSASTSTAPTPAGPASDDGFTKVLTKEERRKLRKVEKHRPQFQFDIGQFRSGKKIGVAHVRDFLLYLLTDGNKPQWIVAENKGNISHVVLLLVPGLLPEHLGLDIPIAANLPFTTEPIASAGESSTSGTRVDPSRSKVPILNKTFLRGVPTRAPGDSRKMHSVIQTLLSAPLTDARRKELEREKEARGKAGDVSTEGNPALAFLLTANQMLDNGYNLPSYLSSTDEIVIPGLRHSDSDENGAENGVVAGPSKLPSADKVDPARVPAAKPAGEGRTETAEADGPPVDGRWPVLSVDCEMVEVGNETALARVSIVDFTTGLPVFDELVKPPGAVTNYRTQWSGMSAARLSGATHTLATIQAALLTGPGAIITPHTVLLGHSLECDLNALRIRHPLCIDTALIFQHPRGQPFKPALRWLSSRYLGQEIQGGKGGHDSEEDARACVGLLKAKIANGPEFGTFAEFTESIFDRLSRVPANGGVVAGDEKSGRRTAVVDYSSTRNGHGARATTGVKVDSDDEVVQNVLEHVQTHDFVFARFMELANRLGYNGTENLPSPLPDLDDTLSALDARLATLFSGLPRNTAVVLLNGHSDPAPMIALSQRRTRWERALKERAGEVDGLEGEERWMAEDDRRLEEEVAKAREGMAFFCVK